KFPMTRFAAVLIELEKIDEADIFIEGGLEQNPEDSDLHTCRGIVHRIKATKGLGHIHNDAACTSFEKALSVDPANDAALNALIDTLVEMGSFQKALNRMDKVYKDAVQSGSGDRII